MTKGLGIFVVLILLLAIWAVKLSDHPIVWLFGLAASIPIYAAIAGALLKINK
jgi:hypothetical protein